MKASHTVEASPEADEAHETHLTMVRGASGPTEETECWAKITIVMNEQHVLYLDFVALYIRAQHPGRVVERAELIRALVEFMERSGIDFTQFRNAREITEGLVEIFRAIPQDERMPLPDVLFTRTPRARRRTSRMEI